MKLEGDLGPCELLFVSEKNIAQVVARTCPGKVLVDRDQFTSLALAMLEIVEAASK